MSSVVTSMRRRINNIGDEQAQYDSPAYFGTRPAYVTASLGAGSNNLEEQLFLGTNKITTTWETPSGKRVIRTEYRKLHQEEGFYFTDHYILSDIELVDNDKALLADGKLQLPQTVIKVEGSGDELEVTEQAVSFSKNKETNEYEMFLKNGLKGSTQTYELRPNENGFNDLYIVNEFTDDDRNKQVEYIELWYCPDGPVKGGTHKDGPNDIIISIKRIYQPYVYIENTEEGSIRRVENREEVFSTGYQTRLEYQQSFIKAALEEDE